MQPLEDFFCVCTKRYTSFSIDRRVGKPDKKKEGYRNKLSSPPLGPFTNYADKFLAFFDHLPPIVDSFYLIKVDILGLPKYPPLLVNIVCEINCNK